MFLKKTSNENSLTMSIKGAYYKAARESKGFDVPYVPIRGYGIIQPIDIEGREDREDLERYAAIGIAHYSKEKGTSLELVKLEKVMQQAVGPFTLYITFTAKETGSDQIRTYQTKVVLRPRPHECFAKFTRVKPEIKSQAAAGRPWGTTKGRPGGKERRGRRKRGKKEEEKEGKRCKKCH